MREDQFRAWLEARRFEGQPLKTVGQRVNLVRRFERAMRELHLPFTDLDRAFDRDGMARVFEEFRALRNAAVAGHPIPAALGGETSNPAGKLANIRAAVGNYHQFRSGTGWNVLTELRDRFLVHNPGFESFTEPGEGSVVAERAYKEAASDKVRDAIGRIHDPVSLGRETFEILKSATPTGPLVRWQTQDAIAAHYPQALDDFYEVIGRLVASTNYAGDALGEAFTQFAEMKQAGITPLTIGEQANILFSALSMARPQESAPFKIKVMNRASNILLLTDIIDGAFEAESYWRFAELFEHIFATMRDDWNWQPRDWFDVQGFLWIALKYEFDDLDELDTMPGDELPIPLDRRHRAAPEPRNKNPMPSPTNLILYGPPGTGKTYTTAQEAVRLCGEVVPDNRDELMALYRSLQHKGRIGFVTFHQNFAYEDFVEGLRPVNDGSESETPTGFSLEPQDGIFKQMAEVAVSNRGRAVTTPPAIDRSQKVFKMSLGRSRASEDDAIYQDAIREGYVTLGWGGEIDWSDPRYDTWEGIKERWRQDHPDASGNDPNMSQMYTFRIAMEIGSLIVVSDGNRKFRAIGVVTGPYQFASGHNGEYNHRRAVRWLWHGESLPRERIYAKELSQVSAYRMNTRDLNWEGLEQTVASGGDAVATSGEPEPHVLIIDEINRANISKVFGELITLLEPDKRLGMPNALTVRLPYSKTEFGVPANLHIIGTMNTADRSIALLDTALRRRFTFREMAPDPSLLKTVEGIPLPALLTAINDRIEYLVDREHRIGHAFFIPCRSRADVDAVMRDKVIPLLQEYFFEDWSRIAAVVGPGFIAKGNLKPPPGMKDQSDRPTWSVRRIFPADAYASLVNGVEVTAESAGNDAADEPE
ncbi:AAA family ATPase [Novosphingobium sp. BL-52-GroH]|uniref:AAA family ATPase n=1 Tax=Novosphingobium sp. BL-52-GroH TaxID=3349877 RepID=UPI0038500951